MRLKTELPGPQSRKLMQERQRHVARGPFHVTPLFVAKAKGALLEDVDGNTLIDFASGIGVLNVGSTAEPVVAAIREQSAAFIHLGFNVTPYEGYVRLAEKLNAATPGSFAKKSFLANSGAEAVENAIKIARAYTHRPAVVCFDHAFHGRTYLAMTLTAKAKPYKYEFAPFCSDVYRAPFPYPFRGQDTDECFATFEDLIQTEITPQQVAAVIIEPVLGEGGFIAAPPGFLSKLQSFCSKHEIVLIADEIQTGFGRTGTLFASEQLGFIPDLLLSAKGLGGGMPISAVTGRAEIMDAPIEGGIGGTFGGNPVACAAALAVFEMFSDGQLLSRARALGEQLQFRLNRWREQFPAIGEVRGLGPMQAIEFVKNPSTREPDADAAKKLIKYCYEHGLVIMTAGSYGNVVRVLLPLVIEDEWLEEGLNIMEAGLTFLSSQK